MIYNSVLYTRNKMKVFISWSGHKSFEVAKALKEWVPCVIQDIEPYFSAEDIDKGVRWSTDISKELEAASFGILCVTKENLKSEWLNFEAGALSKAIDKARVCPFLFDLKPSDISKSPILQFQMTSVDRDDIFKLFKSMNACLETKKLEESRLEKIFTRFWPEMDKAFKEIDSANDANENRREESEVQIKINNAVIEEMLDLLRSQQMLLKDPEHLIPPDYLKYVMGCGKNDFEMMLVERIPQSLLKDHEMIRRTLIKFEENAQNDELKLFNSDEFVYQFFKLVNNLLNIDSELFDRLGIKQIDRTFRR